MAVLPGLAEKSGRNIEVAVRRVTTVPGWPDLISDSCESEVELEHVIRRLLLFEFIYFIFVLFYLSLNLP